MKRSKSPISLVILAVLLFVLPFNGLATTRTSIVAGGSWASTATWSGGVIPVAGDTVVLATNVFLLGNSAALNRLVINPGCTLTFTLAGAAGKTMNIAAGGNITCNGTIDMTGGEGDFNVGAGSTFTLGPGATLIWLPNITTAAGATLFTNTTETINATSTIRLDTWYDMTVPFKQVVSGNLGNLTINIAAGSWDQEGTFAPSVIQGTFTKSGAGQVILDGGAGMTTALTLNDVNVTAGTLIIAQGTDRNLTLVTDNFTVAAGATLVSVMYQTYGTLSFTVNGNLTVNDDFTLIQGPTLGSVAVSSITTVTGDFAIGGGLFDMHRGLLSGNCTISVTGGLSITGAPSWVRFMDMDCTGNLLVNAASFTVSGGGSNFLFLEDGTTNTATYNITGNMSLSGASTLLYLMGGDNGGFPIASVADPRGNLSLNVGGTYSQSGGTFRGIHNNVTSNAGTYTFNYGAINYTGGVYLAHYACNMSNAVATVNVTGNASFSFASAASDQVWFNALGLLGSDPSSLSFIMNIGGNLSISGAAGSWRSSNSTGPETITIGGDMIISGGVNSFNLATSSGLTNYHDVTGTVNGNVTVSGGTTHLSAKNGTVTNWNILGNVSITGGILGVKGGTGAATVNILGGYSQTAGTFFLHNASAAVTANVISVTVNSNDDGTGDFSHTGGVINFDDCATAGAATHLLTVYSPNFTVGGAAGSNITRAGAGTGALFGNLIFARTAGTTYSRTSATHYIQQVKQIINSGVTVTASGSANPFQVASGSIQNNAAGTAALWPLNINGTLDMGSVRITAQGPSLTGYYSGIKVNSGGKLITANINGFYNGANASATLEPQVFSGNVTYRMDFSLDANSTVEYNSNANQVVTGKYPNAGALADVQSGTTSQYKYGILTINNLGTLGTNYANPAVSATGTGNIFIRTNLILTRGEFNLAGSGTGQTIVIENAATTAVTRDGATTTGYVKSEETNGGNNRAIIQWNVGATTGSHVYPFGLYSGGVQYLPVTVNNSGNIGNFSVSTRATVAANTSWAAASNGGGVNAVSHMYDPTLLMDGSVPAVIDRWWDFTSSLNMTAPCTTAIAATSITFSYRGAENTMSAPYNTGLLGAQHWGYMGAPLSTFGWETVVTPAAPTNAVTTGIGSITIPSLTKFSPYILSAVGAPLPIKLISFNASCKGKGAALNWRTASEHNNAFFTVEKSIDGKTFYSISQIEGEGDSHSLIEYNFYDEDRKAAKVFYRLKQTDFNGDFSYSDIIALGCNDASGLTISNLTSSGSDLEVLVNSSSEEDIRALVSMLDMTGKQLHSSTVQFSNGINNIHLEKPASSGVYILKITSAGTTITKRIYISN